MSGIYPAREKSPSLAKRIRKRVGYWALSAYAVGWLLAHPNATEDEFVQTLARAAARMWRGGWL